MDKRSSCYLARGASPPHLRRSERPNILSLSSKARLYSWASIAFRKVFDEKHRAGDILFQEDRLLNINGLPFPRKLDRVWVEDSIYFLPTHSLLPRETISLFKVPPIRAVDLSSLKSFTESFRSYQQVFYLQCFGGVIGCALLRPKSEKVCKDECTIIFQCGIFLIFWLNLEDPLCLQVLGGWVMLFLPLFKRKHVWKLCFTSFCIILRHVYPPRGVSSLNLKVR